MRRKKKKQKKSVKRRERRVVLLNNLCDDVLCYIYQYLKYKWNLGYCSKRFFILLTKSPQIWFKIHDFFYELFGFDNNKKTMKKLYKLGGKWINEMIEKGLDKINMVNVKEIKFGCEEKKEKVKYKEINDVKCDEKYKERLKFLIDFNHNDNLTRIGILARYPNYFDENGEEEDSMVDKMKVELVSYISPDFVSVLLKKCPNLKILNLRSLPPILLSRGAFDKVFEFFNDEATFEMDPNAFLQKFHLNDELKKNSPSIPRIYDMFYDTDAEPFYGALEIIRNEIKQYVPTSLNEIFSRLKNQKLSLKRLILSETNIFFLEKGVETFLNILKKKDIRCNIFIRNHSNIVNDEEAIFGSGVSDMLKFCQKCYDTNKKLVSVVPCNICLKNLCEKCSNQDIYKCKTCRKSKCFDCCAKENCIFCRNSFCETCKLKCERCELEFCGGKQCIQKCMNCSKTFCNECLRCSKFSMNVEEVGGDVCIKCDNLICSGCIKDSKVFEHEKYLKKYICNICEKEKKSKMKNCSGCDAYFTCDDVDGFKLNRYSYHYYERKNYEEAKCTKCSNYFCRQCLNVCHQCNLTSCDKCTSFKKCSMCKKGNDGFAMFNNIGNSLCMECQETKCSACGRPFCKDCITFKCKNDNCVNISCRECFINNKKTCGICSSSVVDDDDEIHDGKTRCICFISEKEIIGTCGKCNSSICEDCKFGSCLFCDIFLCVSCTYGCFQCNSLIGCEDCFNKVGMCKQCTTESYNIYQNKFGKK